MAEMQTGRTAPHELSPQQKGPPQQPVAARGIGADASPRKAGRLRALARSIYQDDRRLQLALLAVMLLLYGPLLWMSWWPKRGAPLELVFNSMLEHLLRGRFDVDPQIVGPEGFVRDGRVYAYWGIWCALLRLPLWILRRMDMDVTIWSCLAAACLGGMAKVRAVLLLRRHSRGSPLAAWAVGLMLAYVLLGGSGIGCLGVSVYHEVILWAAAFASVFVYFAVKGLVSRWFGVGTLSCMAFCAGLGLLTRVSTGIGLLLAMVLLLIVLAVQPGTTGVGERWAATRRLGHALTQRRMFVPLGIVAALIAATGVINYFRWGNPTTFANHDLYIPIRLHPDRLLRLHMYGLFNLKRIPFGLMYYFLPVWVLHGTNGQPIIEQAKTPFTAGVEGPPSSFFLTDLLPFCFIVFLAIALWRRRAGGLPVVGQWAAAVAIGLLAPCILMLAAISMTYRYRMEFYPEIDFLAFLGLYSTVTNEGMLATLARHQRWITAGLTVSIVSSFMVLSLHNVAQEKLHYYYHQAVQDSRQVIARFFASH